MGKERLEAFSDGVIAIIITIMVLEFRRPDAVSLAALMPLLPHVLIYALSFVYVGIYWNNHHHMFHAARSVTGAVLWANLHLLFWLSLVPFVSGWMGEHIRESLPVGLYGCVLLMCGVAYWILARLLVRHEGPDSVLARALGRDTKSIGSVVAYFAAIAAAPFAPFVSLALYAAVAAVWLIPDRRIEKVLDLG
ncbi:MAG: TMEM175 family protein [Pseudomonadota bacterium]